jgi:hypothetical protein
MRISAPLERGAGFRDADISGVLVDESMSSWRLLAAQLVGIWVMLLLSALTVGVYFVFLHGLFHFGIVADSLMRASRLNELQVRKKACCVHKVLTVGLFLQVKACCEAAGTGYGIVWWPLLSAGAVEVD